MQESVVLAGSQGLESPFRCAGVGGLIVWRKVVVVWGSVVRACGQWESPYGGGWLAIGRWEWLEVLLGSGVWMAVGESWLCMEWWKAECGRMVRVGLVVVLVVWVGEPLVWVGIVKVAVVQV